MHEYQCLDRRRKEIRLLTLDPGSGNEMLRCTLEHAFLDISPIPIFETISYVCGDPKIETTLLLHGSGTKVMATSEAALRRMRFEDKPRVLWIDSICIDQASVSERGHQVGMMYEIYTKTSRNLIWLGPYDDSIATAIDTMEAVLEEIVAETAHVADFHKALYDGNGYYRYSETPFSIDIKDAEFLDLFHSPWFSRLWIVQEASLAPLSICHYGRFEVPLTSVLRLANWIQYKWDHLPPMRVSHIRGIHNARAISDAADRQYGRFLTVPGAALSNCLYVFQTFQTFDPRDRVYAVLGLWQMLTRATVLPNALKPDYTLRACDVFMNAVRIALEEANCLRMLEIISKPPRGPELQDATWPSWVPELDQSFSGVLENPLPGAYSVAGSVPMGYANDTNTPNHLILSGILVDDIVKMTHALSHRMSPNEAQAVMADFESPCNETWIENPAGGLETKISQVLQCGHISRKPATNEKALRYYQSFKKYIKDHEAWPPDTAHLAADAPNEHRSAALYRECLHKYAWNRAVFQTEDGHVGLGPSCTQLGDIVAILYGCNLPVVMRPLAKRGEFRLLGMSYVYGIMEGEAVRRHKAMALEDTVFRIV